MTDNEYNEIVKKIDFEEKWLLDIYTKQYRVGTKDIEIAMSGIRSVVAELKGENNETSKEETDQSGKKRIDLETWTQLIYQRLLIFQKVSMFLKENLVMAGVTHLDQWRKEVIKRLLHY